MKTYNLIQTAGVVLLTVALNATLAKADMVSSADNRGRYASGTVGAGNFSSQSRFSGTIAYKQLIVQAQGDAALVLDEQLPTQNFMLARNAAEAIL